MDLTQGGAKRVAACSATFGNILVTVRIGKIVEAAKAPEPFKKLRLDISVALPRIFLITPPLEYP